MNNQDNPYAGSATQGNYRVTQNSNTTEQAQPEKPGLDLGVNAPPPAAAGEVGKDISTAEFMKEVVEASASQPVIIDFWAPWCGPCKQLTPVLEKVAREFAGQAKLVKMDTEQYPEVAAQMKIQSIPAVVVFVGGKPVDAFMGVRPESEIRRFFEKHAGPSQGIDTDKLFTQLRELIAEGAIDQAMQGLQAYMAQDAENPSAMALLGQIMIKLDQVDRANELLEAIDPASHNLPDVVSLKAELELLEQTGDLGEIEGLIKNVQDNPKDHQAKFDLSLAYNARGDREQAVDMLVEIIKADKKWNDEGARKQLILYFEAWGEAEEATKSGRRKMSAALFS